MSKGLGSGQPHLFEYRLSHLDVDKSSGLCIFSSATAEPSSKGLDVVSEISADTPPVTTAEVVTKFASRPMKL